uniref:C3H1-type domain-containing protein n=1 Tax=Neobodo designis TaxID=312471 RepID=A0A7S1Q642_NEODS|mmetsp:Transcript_34018/g.105014  ORF Transcript_34018/g.105014 Transcript_34018/m.105014 type:complete len:331 (+) Transcript_34018:763-1755(+)|eukprot:CAMPEP_0174854832 /NCGR_PEP_ID=MMETSP1114-20130205/31970_1 /TAXON_ID=312471 /ORGANISM="Neobodo designis, Strain CCAP 1951/1" /LENGTH=330 /DNA_ID=CAMNT_0016089543 /DNA_START=763 /DNA_END=1755 /DNA_ORIENTATION=+
MAHQQHSDHEQRLGARRPRPPPTTTDTAPRPETTGSSSPPAAASGRRTGAAAARLHCAIASRPQVIFVVDRADVVTLPDTARDPATGLVLLCPSFLASGGESCSAFPACRLAHARLKPSARTLRPHFAPTVPVPLDTYPTYGTIDAASPSGADGGGSSTSTTGVPVAVPDSTAIVPVRPERCFRTRAPLDDASRTKPLSHCSHWCLKHVCHFGANCRFVHAADIPPSSAFEVTSRASGIGSTSTDVAPATSTDSTIPTAAIATDRRQEDTPSVSVVAVDDPNDTDNKNAGRPADNSPTSARSASASSGEGSTRADRTFPMLHQPYDALPR